MPKKIFSAQEWENAPSKQDMPLPVQLHYNKATAEELYCQVERVVCEIEISGIDIAPEYNQWVSVGFALVDGFGQNGREFFHRISKMHHDYDSESTDKQYNNCLKGNGSGITLASFFYFAHTAGIKLFKYQNTNLPNIQNGKTAKWKKDVNDLPTLPTGIYDSLPPFLQEIVSNSISEEDKDFVLLGAIGCFSACFPNVCGLYDDHIVYSNLYLFLVAEAGMGKGSLNLCRELVAPINKTLHEQSKQMYIEYKNHLVEFQQNKKKCTEITEPEMPPQRTLIIPANSSSSSFISLLADNDGIGLLFETEGDTLSQTLKSEHGNYSDVLRKGFHHETISLSRKKDREFRELESPRFSVVLSGTPRQVQRLIPDEEDGLLSRFIYYFIPFRRGIRNVFATDCISQSKQMKFKQLGERFQLMQEKIARMGPIEVVVSEYCRILFGTWLTNINEECCEEINNGMQGLVRRLGLIAFRIMMLFTVLRFLDKPVPKIRSPSGNIVLECSDEDFHTSLCICETLLFHSAFIYVALSSRTTQMRPTDMESGVRARRYALYNQLPDEFDKSVYDLTVSEMNENLSTASKWIDRFIKDGKLKRVEQGKYLKIKL